jgi:nucleotide-binding universal stress UspA family protein
VDGLAGTGISGSLSDPASGTAVGQISGLRWRVHVYQKILIPIDLDALPIGERSIAIAKTFYSESNQAKIRLINVQPLVPVSLLGYLPPSFDEETQKASQKKLSEISASVPYPPEAISSVVRYGSVYPEVLAEAADWGSDLIIVGSHKPELATYLLGSSAAAIVRHAKCSVLVVR